MLIERPADPDALMYLWERFQEIGAMRGAGFSGVAPITWADIHFYQLATGVQLAPWERRVIQRLDQAYRAELSGSDEPGKEKRHGS